MSMKAVAVAALVALSGSAFAATATVSTLGFDPSRFDVPIYPGATVKLGTANSGKDFAGRAQKSVLLQTSDSVQAVAVWYASHWPGAAAKTYPNAALQQFVKPWGGASISVSISRVGPETQIRMLVPDSY